MPQPDISIVTGAFSYTGKYITQHLLARGERVRTLTNHPDRPHPFGDRVEVAPLSLDDPVELARNLRGATTFYNTSWIRFPHGGLTFDQAVANTELLFRAAKEAGVSKIVHLSVTGASPQSSLPYYRGKGEQEAALARSGVPYAILRPTLIFGAGDILVNNIAWLLRRFPVFALPGSGDYRLQPIAAEEVAAQAVAAAAAPGSTTFDVAGPDVFTFEELVRLIARTLGRKTRIIHVPPSMALFCVRALGRLVGDVILTPQELEGLRQNLLVAGGPPTGRIRFADWLEQNADTVGLGYASELQRHFR